MQLCGKYVSITSSKQVHTWEDIRRLEHLKALCVSFSIPDNQYQNDSIFNVTYNNQIRNGFTTSAIPIPISSFASFSYCSQIDFACGSGTRQLQSPSLSCTLVVFRLGWQIISLFSSLVRSRSSLCLHELSIAHYSDVPTALE